MTMPRTVFKVWASAFSPDEIDDLAFLAVGLSAAELRGTTVEQKARNLQEYVRRRGPVEEVSLFEAIIAERDYLEGQLIAAGWNPGGNLSPATSSTAPPERKPIPDDPGKGPDTPVGTPDRDERGYANFDIRIDMKQNDGYPVYAEASYGNKSYGETARRTLQVLPSDYDFQDQIDYLRDLIAKEPDTIQLGETLYKFLFPPDVWNLFTRTLAQVKAEGLSGVRVRLRLNTDSPELSQIPWEYCRDDRNFLALNKSTPLVRYISTDRPVPGTTPDKVRILLAMASPEDQAELNVTAEENRIRSALSQLIDEGRVELQVIPNATPRELRRTFRRYDPHILHFIGHGTLKPNGEGALVLENDERQSHLVDADDMQVLLQGSSVKLCVLSACKTAATDASNAIMGVAPKLVWTGVPAVIAMQFIVPDKTAISFMHDFYEFLADGRPLDSAVTEARIGIYFDNDDKVFWGIPVLFMRAPDGVIWKRD